MAEKKEKTPRKLPFHKMIPNMITLTALAAGMTSVQFSIAGKWETAVIAIVVASFLDAIDGAVARLLKASSKVGAELDSLSDFLCFGVAPALMMYLWSVHTAGKWGWFISLVYAMAIALRLARFNVAKEEEDLDNPLSRYFVGMPSPVAGLLCLLPLVISFQIDGSYELFKIVQKPVIVSGWMLVMAVMAVSHVPTFSSKQLRIPVRMKIPALAIFAILIAGLINTPWPTLTIIGVIYLLTLPLGVLHYNKKSHALAKGEHDPDDSDSEDENQ